MKVGHIWNLHRLRHIQVAFDQLQPAWHFLLLPLWLEVSQQHLKMFSLLKVFENWLKVSHKEILDNIANITLRRDGIWNLAQTPGKNLKIHEPSEFSNFCVVFESQFPNSTSPQRDICSEHHDTKKLSEFSNFERVCKSNTTIFSSTTDFQWNWAEILKH